MNQNPRNKSSHSITLSALDLVQYAQMLPRMKQSMGHTHRQENRRLVGHFYDMKNRFWAVGCGLGWAVADYEQLLREGFFNFLWEKKKKKKF